MMPMKPLLLCVCLAGLCRPLAAAPEVTRLPGNPIIRPAMLPGADGENINGPSLIRVPDWVANPLGRYYLYFAHHNGHSAPHGNSACGSAFCHPHT